jgi:hypothetical protein
MAMVDLGAGDTRQALLEIGLRLVEVLQESGRLLVFLGKAVGAGHLETVASRIIDIPDINQ